MVALRSMRLSSVRLINACCVGGPCVEAEHRRLDKRPDMASCRPWSNSSLLVTPTILFNSIRKSSVFTRLQYPAITARMAPGPVRKFLSALPLRKKSEYW